MDQGDLQVFERSLQEHLQSKLTQDVPLVVQCAVKHGVLMILGQHPANDVPDPQRTFQALEQSVQLLQSVLPLAEPNLTQEVRLYLKVAGQKQPYAFHSFTIELPQVATPSSVVEAGPTFLIDSPTTLPVLDVGSKRSLDLPAPPVRETLILNPVEAEEPLEAVTSFLEDSEPELSFTDSPQDSYGREDWQPSSASSYNPNAITALEPPDESETDAVLDEPADPGELVPSFAFQSQPVTKRRRSMGLFYGLGAGVGLLILAVAGYGLTRPCVIGSCDALQTAQQLKQESAQVMQQAKSGAEIIEARRKLTTATQTLETIPAWSSHHQASQALLQNYQTQIKTLDQVIAAQGKAIAAKQKSQNSPHPVQEWTEVQRLWQAAIVQLEQIPQNNEAYPLAQRQLQEYRSQLATTKQRLLTEQQANQRVAKAKTTAQVAEAVQGIAQNLDSWQEAEANWQTAVKLLQQVPRSTVAAQEAQTLLLIYQAKLTEARNHKAKEQIAAKSYQQAVNLAQQAKKLEQANQWSQAVATWRKAVANAEQVPTETFYHGQAQALVGEYAASLQQAEDRLKVVAALQQTRSDLGKTCSGSVRICDYSVTSDLIKVRLTERYMRTVLRTSQTAQTVGDSNARIGVAKHLATLQAALEAISDNAGIPIEIRSSNDAFMGRYTPR